MMPTLVSLEMGPVAITVIAPDVVLALMPLPSKRSDRGGRDRHRAGCCLADNAVAVSGRYGAAGRIDRYRSGRAAGLDAEAVAGGDVFLCHDGHWRCCVKPAGVDAVTALDQRL